MDKSIYIDYFSQLLLWDMLLANEFPSLVRPWLY